MFSCEFCEIFKNTLFYTTPPATVFVNVKLILDAMAFSNSKHGSIRPEAFCKKDVLKNFAKFAGKHLCQSLFLNKVASLRPGTSLKNRLWRRYFPVNFAKFLRTHFLTKPLSPKTCKIEMT